MRNDIIDRAEFWGLSHYYYGEAYFGSFKGMRYRIAREPLENVSFASPEIKNAGQIKASVWPEPFAYAKTAAEDITDKLFSFSEEGLNEVSVWLNERYLEEEEQWKAAPRI